MENKENKVTAIKLICKTKEADGKKWINFSTKRGDTWYAVKFVKGCHTPKVVTVTNNVMRAFIGLDSTSTFNMADSPYGKVLYVENYIAFSDARLGSLVEAEMENIQTYREKRESEKISFLAPDEAEIEDESQDLPF